MMTRNAIKPYSNLPAFDFANKTKTDSLSSCSSLTGIEAFWRALDERELLFLVEAVAVAEERDFVPVLALDVLDLVFAI